MSVSAQDLRGLGYTKGKPLGLVGVTELSEDQKKQLKEQREVWSKWALYIYWKEMTKSQPLSTQSVWVCFHLNVFKVIGLQVVSPVAGGKRVCPQCFEVCSQKPEVVWATFVQICLLTATVSHTQSKHKYLIYPHCSSYKTLHTGSVCACLSGFPKCHYFKKGPFYRR